LKRARESHLKNIDRIYVLARRNNYVLAEMVIEEIAKGNLYAIEKVSRYKTTVNGGKVLECFVAAMSSGRIVFLTKP
jgi:hypothetical protein